MNLPAIEPLDPTAWAQSLARLRAQVAVAGDDDTSARLRKAYHLLILTPAPLRPLFAPSVSEGLFEQLLEEAQDIAAMSLLKPDMRFQVLRNKARKGATVKLLLPASKEMIEITNLSLARGIVLAISEAAIRLLEEPRMQNS